MVSTRLYEKIDQKIADCQEKYERDRKDPFLSHVRYSELETWRLLADHLEGGGQTDAAIAIDISQTLLRERLGELEAAKEREEQSPSFSWYGEHYHYLVLEGQCDAYRGMIRLLEENPI